MYIKLLNRIKELFKLLSKIYSLEKIKMIFLLFLSISEGFLSPLTTVLMAYLVASPVLSGAAYDISFFTIIFLLSVLGILKEVISSVNN